MTYPCHVMYVMSWHGVECHGMACHGVAMAWDLNVLRAQTELLAFGMVVTCAESRVLEGTF